MKIPKFRFTWLGYFSKQNIFLKIYKYCFGTLFLHSRAVSHFFFRNLSFNKTDLILDIGSGDGDFANWISYYLGCKIIGIDRLRHRTLLSQQIAQRYKLSNEFLCMDIEKEKVNFEKESFDKILMIDVLEHLENPQRIIQFAATWLKKGGYLFISTPTKNQNRIFLHSYQENFSYGEDRHFFEGFDIPILISWVRKAGFSGEVNARYIFYKFYQFGWELSEIIRKYNKIFYLILFPVFRALAFFDRLFPIGKRGNGIILLAQK